VRRAANDKGGSVPHFSSHRLLDGVQWMTYNLNVNTAPSYRYNDAELNSRPRSLLILLTPIILA
jgi:hypothetical protein